MMNRTIFLRFATRGAAYSLRRLRVQVASQRFSIACGEELELQLPNDVEEVRCRLDYHRVVIRPDERARQFYLIVTEISDDPASHLRAMFSNRLRAYPQREEEFANALQAGAACNTVRRPLQCHWIHRVSFAVGLLLSMLIAVVAIVDAELPDRNFLFIVGLVGGLSYGRRLFANTTTVGAFYAVILGGFAYGMLSGWLMGWLAPVLLAGAIVLITLSWFLYRYERKEVSGGSQTPTNASDGLK